LGAAGGGIWSGNPVTVVNSTIAGNTAQGAGGGGGDTSGFGGGIYMAVNGPDQLTLANATVAFNTASGTAGSQGGNIYLVGSGAQTAVKNSVIADGSADSGSENCFGALHSLGYNLEDRQQCGLSAATDLHPANAALGQLTNNGGPTDTVGLLSGSPAINAGNPSGCTDPLSVTIATDQRRIARPQGARCDIGAFEFRTVTLVGSPQVSGTPRVGNRLRCLLPAVQSPDGPANKTISWLRDGAPVGAGMTYVVRAADAQHFLRCRVLASNSAGSTSARSAAVLVPPPPTVTITSSSVSAAHHKATFKFTTQHATRAKCALARGSATPQYSPCTSPRTYRRLAAGSYAFFVRAVGPGGTSAPARHSFKIR
jgi:hypothetical protein